MGVRIKFFEFNIHHKLLKHSHLIFLCFILTSCFENPTRPQLTTKALTRISDISMLGGGNIINDGGSEIFQKGVCINSTGNPTMADGYTIDGAGSNDFESLIIGFDPQRSLYARAYAVNGAGIGYGDVVSYSFVQTYIESFGPLTPNSIFFRVHVFSDNEVLSRGLCWSTSPDPTVDDYKINEGSGIGMYTATITGLSTSTTYYVRPFASNADGLFYGEGVSFTTPGFPVITTKEIQNAGTFIVTAGGDVTSTGGSMITSSGVCWSASPSPTINDTKTEEYLNYNSFTSDLYGLQPGTTYYVRAYATSQVGTSYGNERVITMPAAAVSDYDGNPYSSVTIGTQMWLVENLKTTHYSNGDAIPNITIQSDWNNASSGAWSYYENVATFNHPYGKLYNWFAVNDPRNVCPVGWHVPSENEWTTMITFLGGSNQAGGKLKEKSVAHWKPYNYTGTNSSVFTALPGGARTLSTGYVYPMLTLGLFWTTTPTDNENAIGHLLAEYDGSIFQYNYGKQMGLSVRCVKD
jgi:uncharacterized protein (TIGR02145 family)